MVTMVYCGPDLDLKDKTALVREHTGGYPDLFLVQFDDMETKDHLAFKWSSFPKKYFEPLPWRPLPKDPQE